MNAEFRTPAELGIFPEINDVVTEAAELANCSNLLKTSGEKKSAPTQPTKLTIYTLKDGRVIRAQMAMKAGDDLVIKDEKGKMTTIKADDVESVKEGL